MWLVRKASAQRTCNSQAFLAHSAGQALAENSLRSFSACKLLKSGLKHMAVICSWNTCLLGRIRLRHPHGVIMAYSHCVEFTRFIWWMQTKRCVVTNPQNKPTDLGYESTDNNLQLPSTSTITIYYYYSARKLILILVTTFFHMALTSILPLSHVGNQLVSLWIFCASVARVSDFNWSHITYQVQYQTELRSTPCFQRQCWWFHTHLVRQWRQVFDEKIPSHPRHMAISSSNTAYWPQQ